ncbi:hypothetical protein BH11PSE2_BH11PSE2_10520 [soil metagenome]
MTDVFLSYKAEDRSRAALVFEGLTAAGISVWWDQHIEAGSNWRASLTERLLGAKCVIVLWTELSVGREGGFVQDEASRAQHEASYLPVRLDRVKAPVGLGQVQAISLIDWTGDHQSPPFQLLVSTVKAMIAGQPRPAAFAPAPPGKAGRRGLDRRTLIGASAIVLGGALGTAYWFSPRPSDGKIARIAVLPFRNLSGDAQQDYLCEGVSEELRGALARLGSIQVAARTSSEAFKSAAGEVAKIAAKLGVSYILDGSLRSSGQNLRVSAQLIDAKRGVEQWSENFDRPMTDVIAVQIDIASRVAEELRPRLGGKQAALVAKPATKVPAAYDALLRGSQAYRRASDEAGYREAVAQYDAAIAADPTCAEAFVRKASALRVIASQYEPADRLKAANDAAVAAAQRAVQLAPESGNVQSTLGYILLFARLDVAGARGPYARSIALSPNDPRVVAGYGQFAAQTGMTEVSLTTLARAASLDPLNPTIYRVQAQALLAARRYPDAATVLARGLALNPDMSGAHSLQGNLKYLQNDTAGAVTEFRAERSKMFRLTGLAIALNRSGDKVGAAQALAELVSTFGDGAAYQQAQIHAQWSQAPQTFAALDRGLAIGDSGLIGLKVDPFMDPVRADPRYAALLKRLGLT